MYVFAGGIEMIGLGNFVYIHALITELILGRLLFLFVTGLVNQLTKPRKQARHYFFFFFLLSNGLLFIDFLVLLSLNCPLE